MAGTPSKPSTVRISELKAALQTLQDIQYDINNPPADSFEAVGDTIATDLTRGDGSGLQGNAANVAGIRYHDNVHYINQGWTDVKQGVNTLVQLLQTTIEMHQATDNNVNTNARQVNTSTTAPAKG